MTPLTAFALVVGALLLISGGLVLVFGGTRIVRATVTATPKHQRWWIVGLAALLAIPWAVFVGWVVVRVARWLTSAA